MFSREGDQSLIDIDTTNTRAATKRGILTRLHRTNSAWGRNGFRLTVIRTVPELAGKVPLSALDATVQEPLESFLCEMPIIGEDFLNSPLTHDVH